MKTLNGAETFGDGTPTLNGHMGGKIYGAYGGALGDFANSLDPALGARYAKANGDYNDAMKGRSAISPAKGSADLLPARRRLASPWRRQRGWRVARSSALAAPPQPWSFGQSLPAILAVAQQQGRNQGY